ncbi:MAG: glutamate--tRNA ligase [Halobacteria archaeon]
MSEVRELIERYALQNAVKYESDAEVGAVMGKLMGEHPDLRERGDEISGTAPEVVSEVNSLDHEERLARLEEIAPELIEELREDDEEEEDGGLPELPGAEELDDVVMRFAPNPNGPPTLGSARGMVINDEYVKEYDGELVLRFDDTDPVNKPPVEEAYDWYLEDAEWLGIDVEDGELYRASDRLETYYDYAEELIELEGAYVCTCSQDEFQEVKKEGEPCPHRGSSVDDNLRKWSEMLEGDYDVGEAVLRVRTDIEHKNPALRDWVAFRVVDTETHPHARVGSRYVVWPMLDFQSGIDDHLLDVTHIIRGKDLSDSEDRQGFVYDYFGWEYPEVVHWGRISIEEYGTLSTSSLAEAIEEGRYDGWDDPRVPSVRAMRRRGIQPEALRSTYVDLGVSKSDIDFSMDHVYAENRKILDEAANRYFFVRSPVSAKLSGIEENIVADVPLHPEEDRGVRTLEVDGEVVLEEDDIPDVGDLVRLKGFCNVRLNSTEPLEFEYVGNDLEPVREGDADVVHWLPDDESQLLNLELRGPTGDSEGVVEDGIVGEEGEVVQFERVGFSRLENVGDESLSFFAHR